MRAVQAAETALFFGRRFGLFDRDGTDSDNNAALGLVFYEGKLLPPRYAGGAFIGQHGSWNRRPPSGYDVVFVRFVNGRPQDYPEQVLGGFLDEDGNARGRPVGVAVDRAGAVLVADDVGNVVWRVTPSATDGTR